MPKFLENKLKKQYGPTSKAPFKIMNKRGGMKGSKVTDEEETPDNDVEDVIDEAKEVKKPGYRLKKALKK